jgi:HK97 family phage portal protein
MVKNFLNKLLKPKVIRKSYNFLDFPNVDYNGKGSVASGVDTYSKNVVVYRCVNLISQSASHVPWVVKKNKKNGDSTIYENHPALQLLRRPNPQKAGTDFFSEVIASKLLYGNAYISSTSLGNTAPRQIYLPPASSTEIVINKGRAVAYKYNSDIYSKTYNIDHVSHMSKVLHIKNYHPTNDHYGLSCLSPANLPIELHQQATIWNNSLLKNGARPSGALIVKDSSNHLTDEQFIRLQEQLSEKFTSSNNSGKPLLLEGGFDWQEMSINPRDMDFIESKNSASREIALAFGVPPQLLGINGDNTYSNMQEARLALWEETLIPLLDKLSDALGNWLSYWYDEDITIDFDRDAISALTEKRENLWSKIATANFMTINEKRVFVGLSPIPGGDKLVNDAHT